MRGYLGAYSSDSVSNNKVEISGSGTTVTDVYGGYSFRGSANDNTVNITGNGTTAKSVYGGFSTMGFEMGLGVNGYMGKQRGIGANASFQWKL